MKSKTFEEFENAVEEVFNQYESKNPSTKLDRRRKIEELEDEKRLRKELNEYA